MGCRGAFRLPHAADIRCGEREGVDPQPAADGGGRRVQARVKTMAAMEAIAMIITLLAECKAQSVLVSSADPPD